MTKVFEGSFSDTRKWYEELEHYAAAQGKHAAEIYYFYATCPRCPKHYGKHFVVGFAKVS